MATTFEKLSTHFGNIAGWGVCVFLFLCSVTDAIILQGRTAAAALSWPNAAAATELAQRSKPGAILAQLRHMLFNVVLHGEVQHRAGLAGVCVLVSAPIVRRVAKMVH